MDIPFIIFATELDAIIWNAIAALIVFVYIMTIIKIMDVMVSKGFPQDISRKIIHIAAGSWIIFWPIFYPLHWSYTFNIVVAVLWTLLFLQKGLKGTPDDPAVKTMTRTGDPKELLKGPLFFTLVMEFIGIFYFMRIEGVLTMAALGWGDGLAPVFGKYYGKNKYSVFGNEKSIQGSIAMFVFSLFAMFLLTLIVLPNVVLSDIVSFALKALALSAVATLVEALSPKDVDNLIIPAALLIFLYLI